MDEKTRQFLRIFMSDEESPVAGFDRYQELRSVGTSRYGTIYAAYDRETKRRVVIQPCRALQSTDVEVFIDEMRFLSSIHHPGIVAIHDVGVSPTSIGYVVLELVEGESLASRLKSRPPSFREAAEIIAQLADTLHFLHQRDVIHGDLNPANIFLTDGRPVIGFGKRIRGSDLGNRIRGASTPRYLSPEEFDNLQAVDARSDVYSLGVIFHEMLVGQKPVNVEPSSFIAVVTGEVIPATLERICRKAVSERIADRYSTALDFSNSVRSWLRQTDEVRLQVEAPTAEEISSLGAITFRRDLPGLLSEKSGWCVAYHGDNQIGFAKTARELYKECNSLGIPREEIYINSIEPPQPLEVDMYTPP